MIYYTLCEKYLLKYSPIKDMYPEVGDAYISFDQAVNFMLSKGWRLQGGVASIGTSRRAYLVQALVIDDHLAPEHFKL